MNGSVSGCERARECKSVSVSECVCKIDRGREERGEEERERKRQTLFLSSRATGLAMTQ